MGNPNSKSSFQNNSMSNDINFVQYEQTCSYQRDEKRNGNEVGSRGPNDVLTKFTWNYGGTKVSLTGSFNNWQIMIPMERSGQEFSITLLLPRGVYQYKFIVDKQWRFSPEDPTMPDVNGHINNYIDTTNFQPWDKNLRSNGQKYGYDRKKTEKSDRPIFQKEEQTNKTVSEFAPQAPKRPPHYQYCEFLGKQKRSSPPKNHSKMEEPIYEETLSQEEIEELFKTPHCLPMPSHVTLDHLVTHNEKDYCLMTVTQRFKEKYTTFTHYSIQNTM